jgi:predicted lipid-binding transport protein (Tim44 family)
MISRHSPDTSSAYGTKSAQPVLLWKTFVGPLVAALIAGAGAFIGMQREMSVVTSSVNRMTSTVEKIADKQTTFFESFYVPLALKVEQQGSAINSVNTSLNNLKDEMRYLHPTRGNYTNGR